MRALAVQSITRNSLDAYFRIAKKALACSKCQLHRCALIGFYSVPI